MQTITLENLKDKSIKYFVDKKIAIMTNNKEETETLVKKFIPDYFENKYTLNDNAYLSVFTKNWITEENSLLLYDLITEFNCVDKQGYKIELTENNLLDWLDNKIGYDINKILLFKEL